MHERAKRSVITGWTPNTVRRHTKWLYSVDTAGLTGHGVAVTLTMRDCPETAEDFRRLLKAWTERTRRFGQSRYASQPVTTDDIPTGTDDGSNRGSGALVRLHWVIEWQRRGVPHVHAAVYFDRPLTAAERFRLVSNWVEIAEPYGVRHDAQHHAVIDGPTGWLQYLSKHAARGAAHYQRQGKPAGWEKTGRLWGHVGEWPVESPLTFQIPREAYFRFRRMVRSWRLADARLEKDPDVRRRRISSARRMLRSNNREASEVRGISEWIGQLEVLPFVALFAAQGYDVVQVDG